MNKSSIAYVLSFMLAISAVFGFGLAAVHHGTQDTLAKNEQLHRNRTLCRAFGLDVKGRDPEAYEKAVNEHIAAQRVNHGGRVFDVFVRKDAEAPVVGFLFQGQGVWGPIRGFVVLSSDLSTIKRLAFLEHHETPGLGARIEEPWFSSQFQGLTIGWDRPQEERVIIGSAPDPSAKNRVDAITGATQTSLALMKSLNAELEAFRNAYQTPGKGL